MSIKVAKSRFITSSLKGLYKYLTYHLSSFQALGERFIHEAETAQAFRQTEKLEELGLILSHFPVKEYRLAGQYYLSWCLCRKGEGTREKLEHIIENSTRYRSRALIDLGTIEAGVGNFDIGLKHYAQAVKYTPDIRALSQAIRSIAAVKGLEGFHKQSWKDLERITPLVRYSPPIEQFQYLNSLAVELTEVGRIEEAQNVCQITLASPFVFAYPEWRETGQDLALREYKSRSSVPVIQSFLAPKTQNVLCLPERERLEVTRRSPFFQPSDVTSLEDWKNKMVKEPNGNNHDAEDSEQTTEQDLVLQIMELVAKKKFSKKQLLEIRNQLEKKNPDMSDD